MAAGGNGVRHQRALGIWLLCVAFLVFAMVNEAAHILDEGIARRPLDVDLIKILGYGFPRWRGGPLFYADTLGLERVRAAIDGYARNEPLAWPPAPLLDRLLAEGKRFMDLN